MRKHMWAAPVFIAVLAGSAVVVNATEDTDPDDTEPDGLVTEEVEPGVERIISDGAGHDLDETHPTYRYDMDDVFVTSDGTVWLSTTHSRSDNEANPPGALVWALGQPGTSTLPEVFCGTFGSTTRDGETVNTGVGCFNGESGEEKFFLAGVPINQVAVAPDGTVWVVGGFDGDNGGLYHITPDWVTDAAPTTTSPN
jgi:hypothetical protein